MTQQPRQALDDRQPQAQALAPVTLRIVELIELLGRSPRAGRPECPCRCPRPRCAPCRRCAGNRARRRPGRCSARRWRAGCGRSAPAVTGRCTTCTAVFMHFQRQPLLRATGAYSKRTRSNTAAERNRRDARLDDSGIEPRDVQQRVEQLLHRIRPSWRMLPMTWRSRVGQRRVLAAPATNRPSACSGWRRSWLAAARKRDLAMLASSAASFCLRSSPIRPEVLEPQADGLVMKRDRRAEQTASSSTTYSEHQQRRS